MQIHEFDVVDSTNSELKKLAANGAAEWVVITAKKQLAGRGRYDRIWESAEGNLFLSLLVKPNKSYSSIALVAGLAALKAAKFFDKKSDLKLKWPNDILKNGKKCGGILIEAEGENIIIGLGINLKLAPEYAEKLGAEIIPYRDAFLSEFRRYYDIWEKQGFKSLKNEYVEVSAFLNEEITIKLPQMEIKAKFIGIGDEGEILLENEGKELIITSGEIYA